MNQWTAAKFPFSTRLAGRTAVITGATSGIGEAIAHRLAAEGAHVLLSGRDTARGDAVISHIRDAGGQAQFQAADLAGSYDELRGFAAGATEALGGDVDILVNNAGIFPVVPTEQLPDADLDRMLAINVRAPHVLVGQMGPAMADRGHGAVINIGSWMARMDTSAGAMYTATKAALEQMTRNWAAEYGKRGVRVNTVAPGATRTPGNEMFAEARDAMATMTPARVPVEPDEVAAAVAYLASDDALRVHGATLSVDGGISAVLFG